MPFTISHAVAILPLCTGRPGRLLNPTALVIGTMIPDLPLFVPVLGSYSWSHSAIGPITYDLAYGLAVFVLWTQCLRRPLADLAPVALSARFPPARTVAGRDWVGVAISIVIGSATHAVWDSFTHARRWATTQLPVLNAVLGPMPVFRWLQLICSVGGMIVLVWWVRRWWKRTSPRPAAAGAPPFARHLSWIAIPATALLGAILIAAAGLAAGTPPPSLWRQIGTGSVAVLMAAVVSCCLCWWLLLRTRATH